MFSTPHLIYGLFGLLGLSVPVIILIILVLVLGLSWRGLGSSVSVIGVLVFGLPRRGLGFITIPGVLRLSVAIARIFGGSIPIPWVFITTIRHDVAKACIVFTLQHCLFQLAPILRSAKQA